MDDTTMAERPLDVLRRHAGTGRLDYAAPPARVLQVGADYMVAKIVPDVVLGAIDSVSVSIMCFQENRAARRHRVPRGAQPPARGVQPMSGKRMMLTALTLLVATTTAAAADLCFDYYGGGSLVSKRFRIGNNTPMPPLLAPFSGLLVCGGTGTTERPTCSTLIRCRARALA
jgi:hypothetical protein